VQSLRTNNHTLPSHLRLCSLFVAPYDSQKLQWKYPNPPPHGEVEVNLQPTVSRPVCLGVSRPSGTCDQFFFLLEISFRQLRVSYFVAPSLTRGRVCNLLYNCFWALKEQSLLGQIPQNARPYFTGSRSHIMADSQSASQSWCQALQSSH
jgi:hypothetical protein